MARRAGERPAVPVWSERGRAPSPCPCHPASPVALAPGCSSKQSQRFTVHLGLYTHPSSRGKSVQLPLENSPNPDIHMDRAKQERSDLHMQVICFIVHYFSPFICRASVQEIIYLLTNSDNLKTVPRTFAMLWFQLPPLIP